MGAWGTGVFANDGAMDWTAEFQQAPAAQSLREAFETAVGTEDYLEIDPGCHALAAAEVVAAAVGKPGQDIPQALRDWASANPAIATPQLIALARSAIDRVMMAESSEVAELWAETARPADAAEWLSRIDDLRQRLA